MSDAVLPLGIRENLTQFTHQLIQVLLVGFAIGMMRTVIPAMAESEFGVARGSFLLLTAFVVAFGVVKGVMNFVAGQDAIVTNQMVIPGHVYFDQATHDADAHARPDLVHPARERPAEAGDEKGHDAVVPPARRLRGLQHVVADLTVGQLRFQSFLTRGIHDFSCSLASIRRR